MNESEKILMTQNQGNMYSPRSIYTTVGRRKSRDPLNNTEINTTQTNIKDLNNSYHFTSTLPNNNFSRARSNTRLNTANNLHSQNFRSKLGNYFSNLKSHQQQELQQLNALNNSNLLMNSSNFNNTNILNNYKHNNSHHLIDNMNIHNKTMRSEKQQNYSNTYNQTQQQSNNNNFLMQNIAAANTKDENERVKLSNSILSKANMDLKNQVRLLQIELSATTTGNPNSMHHRMQVDDPQLAHFVQNLKDALATSQHSNQELTGLFEGLQKKNAELSKENLILKEQGDLANKELESLSKKFNDTRFSVDELTSALRKLENEKTVLLIHKQDFEEKYKLSEEKVENIISINESHLKCKNDNLEMIENLKLTIETLRRGDNNCNKASLAQKIEELEALLKERSYGNDSLQNKLKSFENDREYYGQELKLLEKELHQKDKFIEELQQKYHETNCESEKAKSRIEALLINIDERDQTIQNLKSSMSFISTTIEDYKIDYEKVRMQTDTDGAEKSKLIKELEFTSKRLGDLTFAFDALQSDKELLQKRSLETENELNQKKMSLSKLLFEMDVLTQKLENNQSFIERMQEEIKNTKQSKINEEFQAEITRSTEERGRRLKELEKTLSAKNKQIEDLQRQIHDVNSLKDDKINELQAVINKKTTEVKELDYKMNDRVTDLKHEIEISSHEILIFKSEKERENIEITNKYNQLKADYEILQRQYNSVQKSFNDFLHNKNSSSSAINLVFPSINQVDSNSTKTVINNNQTNNKSGFDSTNVISYNSAINNNNTYNSANVVSQYLIKGQNFNAEDILKKIRDTTANLNANSSNLTYSSSPAFDLNINNSTTSNLVMGANPTKNYLSNSGNFFNSIGSYESTNKASNKVVEINQFDTNTYNLLSTAGNPSTTKTESSTRYFSTNNYLNSSLSSSAANAYPFLAGVSSSLNNNFTSGGEIVSAAQVLNKFNSGYGSSQI